MTAEDKPEGRAGAKRSRDWLDALTVIGRILILTPFFHGAVVFLYEVLTTESIEETVGLDLRGSAYAVGLVFLCGVVTLAYVAAKRFQEGLSSGRGRHQKQGNGDEGNNNETPSRDC